MHRYQILIEYEGTNFIGWQIQPKGRSVQKIIQNNLSKLLKEKITLVGAGRTDSGVHAMEQSAHFDSKIKIKNLKKLTQSLNFFLNKNLISIISVKKKNKKFHSRFSAKKRIYKYVIFNRLSPPSIQKNKTWHIIKTIDISLVKKGAKKFLGTHDFSTYRSSNCSAKSSIKTIDFIKVKKKKNIIEIYFKSQSFLQQQVRSMVGCLKYLGEKKWNLKKFEKVLVSKNRSLCAPPAPPHGLFLEKVIY
jgi:tRNA pseudouridine38-40 synthase